MLTEFENGSYKCSRDPSSKFTVAPRRDNDSLAAASSIKIRLDNKLRKCQNEGRENEKGKPQRGILLTL